MAKWFVDLARKLSSHSDAVAVVRAGRKAKRRTRRRERHQAKAWTRRESNPRPS